MMNCCYAFGPPDGRFADEKGKAVHASMIMAPGATPMDAILLHLPDQGDQAGLPRLLVRDVSEADNRNQPPMRMKRQTFTNFGNADSNRIFIDRNHVVEPYYKVLLYPFRTGEKLPATTWEKSLGTLKINLPDGSMDTVHFDHSHPDHRTRVLVSRETSR